MANLTKSRLDMGHGFMKCIIKNQVERDNYDKKVKAKRNEKCRHGSQTRTKKPEIQTYIPPSRSKIKQESEGSVLFDLEYEDHLGEIYIQTIHKGDDLDVLAQTFAQAVGLTEPLIQALSIKLHDEVAKRSNMSNGRIS